MRKAENGGDLVMTFAPHDWRHHPTQDLCMVRVAGPADAQPLVAGGLKLDDLMGSTAQMDARMVELNVGIGDEVFMPGRFIQLERSEIRPVLRFGNLSLFPEARLRGGNGLMTEAYLAEMRSQSGDSGSPVFVYIGPGSDRGNGTMMPFFEETIGLLGVVTGHIDFNQANALVMAGNHAWSGSYPVKYNTAMEIICPSYRIRELLDLEEHVEEREQEILEARSNSR
ncbi:hypothetical protein [uncultured Arthrobacter sp.]|uniref:hypothetical protein n=1 Tax=uncultured Arthrobacter sp. TaxID=114050 RepID=UPI00260EFD92|nr:hypothetical protein [uncultured Arthrobacter sp.]